MLILSRKKNEAIVISLPNGQEIRIKVRDVQSSRACRLEIDAPRDVPIHRQEVWDAIQKDIKTVKPDSPSSGS